MDIERGIYTKHLASYYAKMRENTFLNKRIEGANTVERLGDFILTPSQYLFGGRKVTFVQGQPVANQQIFNYKNNSKIVELLKLAAAVLALVPSLIIGSAVKGLGYVSRETRKKHKIINDELYPKKYKLNNKYIDHSNVGQSLTTDEIIPCQNHERDGKVPERHKHELEALKATAKILEENNIPWWADFGTALGAYRYGGFIPWDTDVDISILHQDHAEVYKMLYAGLDKEKYELRDMSCYKEPGSYLMLYMKECGTTMDLYPYKVDSDKKTAAFFFGHEDSLFIPQTEKDSNKRCTTPILLDKIFPLKKAKFEDMEVRIPNAAEEILKFEYGENLDPARVWNKGTKKYEKVEDHPYWQLDKRDIKQR